MSAYGSHLIPQADVPGIWANPGQTPLITTQHRKSLALTPRWRAYFLEGWSKGMGAIQLPGSEWEPLLCDPCGA